MWRGQRKVWEIERALQVVTLTQLSIELVNGIRYSSNA